MHDKPENQTAGITDPADGAATVVASLINELAAADPAEAPDLADSVAGHLEAGLASDDVPGSPHSS